MKKIIFIFSILLFALPSFSAQVSKVKGSSVLINTQESNVFPGQIYYTVSNGKKIGIIKILKIKSNQAIGKILKGTARPQSTLLRRKVTKKRIVKKSAPKLKAPVVTKRKSSYGRKNNRITHGNKLGVGFVIGYNSNSADVNFLTTTESGSTLDRADSYSGTSMSFEGILDYNFSRKLSFRGSLGMHNYNAGDETNLQCLDSTEQQGAKCLIDLGYFNLDLWGRYKLTHGWSNIWAGAGIGILMSPKINGTTALNPDDVATTMLIQAGFGADISPSSMKRLYFPTWVEYGMFPGSDTVKMSSISFYAGVSYRL